MTDTKTSTHAERHWRSSCAVLQHRPLALKLLLLLLLTDSEQTSDSCRYRTIAVTYNRKKGRQMIDSSQSLSQRH